MRSINEQCVRQLNGEVDESEIQNIMRYGRSDIDDEYGISRRHFLYRNIYSHR